MFTLPLAVGIFMKLLMVLWILIALFLILIVLIQKAKGGGLSSAFGGLGASSLLGTKTGDVLTWVTISLAVIFLGLGAFLVKFYRPSEPTGLPSSLTPATATTPATGGTATTPAGGADTTGAGAPGAAQPTAPAPTETPAAPAQPVPAAPAEPAPAAPTTPAPATTPPGN